MRTAETSPFTPGYGVLPEVWAGREREFADFDQVVLPRVRGRMYERARLVTGDRGVGKTVFLTHLEDDARAAGCWPVRVSARRGDALVRDLLVATARRVGAHDRSFAVNRSLGRLLQVIAGITVGPRGVEVDVDSARPDTVADPGEALASLLVVAARSAASHGAALILLLDETQNAADETLGDVCHALQQAQTTADTATGPRGEQLRRYVPLAVYIAGLPGIVDKIRRAGATFFERSAVLDFGLLAEPDVRAALAAAAGNREVSVDADALDAMVEAIGGYPYFLHVIGRQVWLAGDGPVITRTDADAGITAARTEMARFYGERVRDLGEIQHDWLMAAARLPPSERTVGAVAAAMHRSSSQLGSTVNGLVDRGLIRYAPGRGRFEFALPGLAEHLTRG